MCDQSSQCSHQKFKDHFMRSIIPLVILLWMNLFGGRRGSCRTGAQVGWKSGYWATRLLQTIRQHVGRKVWLCMFFSTCNSYRKADGMHLSPSLHLKVKESFQSLHKEQTETTFKLYSILSVQLVLARLIANHRFNRWKWRKRIRVNLFGKCVSIYQFAH